PAATLFVDPAGCQEVGGTTSATGGHAEVSAGTTGTSPAPAGAPPARKPPSTGPLQADLATTREVALSWGGSGSCGLERKNAAGEWPRIASSADGKAADSKIDAY